MKYINDEPLKERLCPDCGKPTKQRRVFAGKIKMYRIYVHKDTRREQCEQEVKEETKYIPRPHKSTCECPRCNSIDEMNRITLNESMGWDDLQPDWYKEAQKTPPGFEKRGG